MTPENKFYKEWFIIDKSIIHKVNIPSEFYFYGTIGEFVLYVTNDLNIETNSHGFLMLGTSVRSDIITKNTLDGICKISDLSKLCGNYAIVYANKIFSDSFGVNSIFYSTKNKIISSNLYLIKELFHLNCIEKAVEYIDITSGHYTPVDNTCFLSPASEYVDIESGLIRIRNKKILNYKKYINLSTQKRIDKILQLQHNIYTNLYNNYNKIYTTLSSGLHSRISLMLQTKYIEINRINALTINTYNKVTSNSVIPNIICKKLNITHNTHEIYFNRTIGKNKYYYQIDPADYKWIDDELDYLSNKNTVILKHYIYEIPSNFYDNRTSYYIIDDSNEDYLNTHSLYSRFPNCDIDTRNLIIKNIRFFKKQIKNFKFNNYVNDKDYYYIFYRPLFISLSNNNFKPCKYDIIVPINNNIIIDILMSFTKRERDYNNPNNIWINLIKQLDDRLLKIPINSFTNCKLRYNKS